MANAKKDAPAKAEKVDKKAVEMQKKAAADEAKRVKAETAAREKQERADAANKIKQDKIDAKAKMEEAARLKAEKTAAAEQAKKDKAEATAKAKQDKLDAAAKAKADKLEAKQKEAADKLAAKQAAKDERARLRAERIANQPEGATRLTPDHSKYVKVKTAHRLVRDTADPIAVQLREAKDLNEVFAIGSKALGVPATELASQYAHLNPGMQRMNVGNRMRAAAKAAEEAANPKPKAEKVPKAKPEVAAAAATVQ